MRDFALKNNINIHEKWKLAVIIKRFRKELEDIRGVDIKVLNRKLPPPGPLYCPKYSYSLLGWPDCLICLTTDCIQIEDIIKYGENHDK